jgi:2-amino-4-hydroxy-6-hydroxymethyldihydropteridine diphosphokinase
MPDVFVGVGSNADPERGLATAVAELAQRFGAVRCSSVYRSESWGLASPDYLNMVAAFITTEPIVGIRAALGAIEERAGRRREDPKVCALDLDVLSYGVCVDAVQRLPRPGLFSLPFVLAPLAELAPDFVHPLSGASCRAAWQAAASSAAIENVGKLESPR